MSRVKNKMERQTMELNEEDISRLDKLVSKTLKTLKGLNTWVIHHTNKDHNKEANYLTKRVI